MPRELYATVENTTCGGTVKVALASADTNCISQYWAVLYDSAGAVQARQNLSAAGKADFANLSSGTYKVKLEKKDGSDNASYCIECYGGKYL